MVTQIQPVVRLQRMDEQRQLKEILTAVVSGNVQLGMASRSAPSTSILR